MDNTIKSLLSGHISSNIFPFLWVHGESETVIREYMAAIYHANIRSICVESRPHPDFAGPQWWHDMDIILDEARNRGMQIWILDDSHFPTGYANGAVEGAPSRLCRQSLVRKHLGQLQGGETLSLSYQDCIQLPPWQQNQMEQFMMDLSKTRKFNDDRLAGVVAVPAGGGEIVDLTLPLDSNSSLFFSSDQEVWNVYSLILTRNRGPHRNYINMMDKESCRLLIDAVYEPHWERYQKDFGKTIAGFFSDEPELGNGHLYGGGLRIWEEEDLPWSTPLEKLLREKWSGAFAARLALLWECGRPGQETWSARQEYMDAVTELVRNNFSHQLGDWCRAHGVEYIGHLIEDNNQHTRTGPGLGHYFRGLSGQDMAGIDDIGGQVIPQGEDSNLKGLTGENRNGPFYHYVLGRLGASLAAIDPCKKGRCMCEVFGAYGWQEGVKLEKYLADHFMVRGVNRFVPHAFSMKEYPDPDCPPHFYAHGHNPQYRHFGWLMAYMSRVTELISGGHCVSDVAILYPAESDWAGETTPLEQIAVPLADAQISYDFIPADVFSQRERYKTSMDKGLVINHHHYQVLIIPGAQTLAPAFIQALPELKAARCQLLLVGQCPENLPEEICLCSPEELPTLLQNQGIPSISIAPANSRVRCLHYHAQTNRYLFINEDTEVFRGKITVPSTGPCYCYNAWDNRLEEMTWEHADNITTLFVELEPSKSLIVIFDTPDCPLEKPLRPQGRRKLLNDGWQRSLCKATDYPIFQAEQDISLPDKLAAEHPEFSGYVRYRRQLTCSNPEEPMALEISQAYEGVELLVNGKSLGIQICAPFRYDLTGHLLAGTNQLEIQVATTLERENIKNVNPIMASMGFASTEPTTPSGISGHVELICCE